MSRPARQLEYFDNLVQMFLARAGERGNSPFLWAKREGQWRSISWADARRQVTALATSLKAIGLEPGDRVCLVSENRPEWLISDLAIMATGCVTVPTYTTNTTRDHAHILGNSGAKAVIVSNQKLAKALVQLASQPEPPLRWPAGADAVETFEKKANELLAQANAYRGLSTSLAFDDIK